MIKNLKLLRTALEVSSLSESMYVRDETQEVGELIVDIQVKTDRLSMILAKHASSGVQEKET